MGRVLVVAAAIVSSSILAGCQDKEVVYLDNEGLEVVDPDTGASGTRRVPRVKVLTDAPEPLEKFKSKFRSYNGPEGACE